MPLEVLFRSDEIIAVNKPAGMLVHASQIADGDALTVQQILRRQLQRRVSPIHRLDRATSGVLVFAFSAEGVAHFSKLFAAQMVEKKYFALVRGFLQDCHEDSALKKIDESKSEGESAERMQAAQTSFHLLRRFECPFAVDRYPHSRYSWIEAKPLTGRRHQIRRHLKRIHHPIIGDTTYGKSTHNRFFRTHFGFSGMALHCAEMIVEGQKIEASLREDLQRLLRDLAPYSLEKDEHLK